MSEVYLNKIENMGTAIAALGAENARLRAELEALKPKLVIEVRYATVLSKGHVEPVLTTDTWGGANLKLTFHDGRLVASKVIG